MDFKSVPERLQRDERVSIYDIRAYLEERKAEDILEGEYERPGIDCKR